jgi:hypothetical protein
MGATFTATTEKSGPNEVKITFTDGVSTHEVRVKLAPRSWTNNMCWFAAAWQVVTRAMQGVTNVTSVPRVLDEQRYPGVVTIATCP